MSPGYANREPTVTVTQPFGCVLREVFCSCVSDIYSRGKSCNVVLTLCFKVFMPPHILYRRSVFVFLQYR